VKLGKEGSINQADGIMHASELPFAGCNITFRTNAPVPYQISGNYTQPHTTFHRIYGDQAVLKQFHWHTTL
jgi:hypothetical protein